MEGELSNGSQRGFERFHIEPEAGETVIECEFADTAELLVMLDRLQDLGFELIAVSLAGGASLHSISHQNLALSAR